MLVTKLHRLQENSFVLPSRLPSLSSDLDALTEQPTANAFLSRRLIFRRWR